MITFADEDGTELQSGKVPYNKTPVYEGEEPAKEAEGDVCSYTFAGWTDEDGKEYAPDADLPAATADATYTATYTATPKGQVAAPVISPAAGSYERPLTVTITCATEGASVYYIADDAEPVLYSGPITLNESATIESYAMKAGMIDSERTAAKYTVTEPEPRPYYPVYVQPKPEPGLPFTDVTKDMDIYDDVKYVYEKGIMIGVSDTLFGPELSLTRGMIVTILHRMEGEPKAPYSGVFSDVPAGQWYTDGVEWAASVGIVLGYGDGTYGTTDNVTREQLAAILYRYAQWKGYAVKTAALKAADAEDVSDWAAEAMAWAAACGVLKADADGGIRPGAEATRAEIAEAIHVFLEKVA
jgi:hypothetical protein